jgi:hypothetical protein
LNSCFLLWHSHTIEDDDNEILIGVYASSKDAEAAIQRVKDQPGFRDYPEGFEIAEYIIGKDHWSEGFFTWEQSLRNIPEGDSN